MNNLENGRYANHILTPDSVAIPKKEKDKKDRATVQGVLDARTVRMLTKMQAREVFEVTILHK